MKHTAFIDMTVKIEADNLADFLYYMKDTQEQLEDAGRLWGEILELNVKEEGNETS